MTHFGFAHSCRVLAPIAAALLLVSCMTRPPAPVSERAAPPPETIEGAPPAAASAPPPEAPPPTHTVKRGETLYQIALDHGLDYRELAATVALQHADYATALRQIAALTIIEPGREIHKKRLDAVKAMITKTPG